MRLPRLLAVVGAVLTVAACSDLDRYQTRQDEVWRGQVVASRYVRRGFDTLPTLDLAPLDLSNTTSAPGRITTSDGTFVDAALLPIAPAAYDAFGELDLGQGHARSFPFFVTVTGGPNAGQLALAVLSALENDTLELRIIHGTGVDPAGGDLYGVFPLSRRER